MADPKEVLIGKIAVEQSYVTQDELAECISVQNEESPPRPLGEVFTERGYLTKSQLAHILEIQKANLEKVDPRTSEKQRDVLFGRLAVGGGFLTSDELKEALRLQGLAEAEGTYAQLGDMMMRLGYLTGSQVQSILARQKKCIMTCPACGWRFNIPLQRDASAQAPCPKCGASLLPVSEEEPIDADDSLHRAPAAAAGVATEQVGPPSAEQPVATAAGTGPAPAIPPVSGVGEPRRSGAAAEQMASAKLAPVAPPAAAVTTRPTPTPAAPPVVAPRGPAVVTPTAATRAAPVTTRLAPVPAQAVPPRQPRAPTGASPAQAPLRPSATVPTPAAAKPPAAPVKTSSATAIIPPGPRQPTTPTPSAAAPGARPPSGQEKAAASTVIIPPGPRMPAVPTPTAVGTGARPIAPHRPAVPTPAGAKPAAGAVPGQPGGPRVPASRTVFLPTAALPIGQRAVPPVGGSDAVKKTASGPRFLAKCPICDTEFPVTPDPVSPRVRCPKCRTSFTPRR